MSIAAPFAAGTPTASKDHPDRGADGAIPPDGEENTFGLPEGEPLARAYRRFLRRIAREVLGDLPQIGFLPHDWPNLTDWRGPMAAAMTPLLGAYWDEAGKETRARLGLDPDEWRVVDPHLHAMVENQSHNLCQSTLQTTADDCRTAYRKLNEELLSGLVERGDSVPELAKRVKRVFAGATKEKAVQIARTEASRAVHAASLESAKESGVVAGKKWLAAGNSCSRCLAEAAKGVVPLDDAFSHTGGNPTYSTVKTPPLHPHDRCSIVYVLTAEYQALVDANPPASFAPGALGPEAT